jgi:hypothetical protein
VTLSLLKGLLALPDIVGRDVGYFAIRSRHVGRHRRWPGQVSIAFGQFERRLLLNRLDSQIFVIGLFPNSFLLDFKLEITVSL